MRNELDIPVPMGCRSGNDSPGSLPAMARLKEDMEVVGEKGMKDGGREGS